MGKKKNRADAIDFLHFDVPPPPISRPAMEKKKKRNKNCTSDRPPAPARAVEGYSHPPMKTTAEELPAEEAAESHSASTMTKEEEEELPAETGTRDASPLLTAREPRSSAGVRFIKPEERNAMLHACDHAGGELAVKAFLGMVKLEEVSDGWEWVAQGLDILGCTFPTLRSIAETTHKCIEGADKVWVVDAIVKGLVVLDVILEGYGMMISALVEKVKHEQQLAARNRRGEAAGSSSSQGGAEGDGPDYGEGISAEGSSCGGAGDGPRRRHVEQDLFITNQRKEGISEDDDAAGGSGGDDDDDAEARMVS